MSRLSKYDPERRALEEFRKSLKVPEPKPKPEPVRKRTRLQDAQGEAEARKAIARSQQEERAARVEVARLQAKLAHDKARQIQKEIDNPRDTEDRDLTENEMEVIRLLADHQKRVLAEQGMRTVYVHPPDEKTN